MTTVHSMRVSLVSRTVRARRSVIARASMRSRIACSWPCNPSAVASTQATGASASNTSGSRSTTDGQRTKSITDSGPRYLAAPWVGSVWLGPAT